VKLLEHIYTFLKIGHMCVWRNAFHVTFQVLVMILNKTSDGCVAWEFRSKKKLECHLAIVIPNSLVWSDYTSLRLQLLSDSLWKGQTALQPRL